MSDINRSVINVAKEQLYTAWGTWAELTGRRYRKLLILASARSGSTLLAHILASNHQIFGMGEAKITYRSAGDFRRLTGKNLYFYWRKKRPLSGHERYVMDKLVHNHLLEAEHMPLLAEQRVHTIFLLRKPGPTLKSFMRAVKVDQSTALAYFVSRMETLTQYAQRLEGTPALLLTYNQLVTHTGPALKIMQDYLELQRPLSEHYQVNKSSGVFGLGDKSENIRSGRIVAPEQAALDGLDPVLLETAREAHQRCLSILKKHCLHLAPEQLQGEPLAQPS